MTGDLVPATDGADRTVEELTRQFLDGRRSEHTRAAYYRDLRSWLLWCATDNIDPRDAWQADVLRWQADLADGTAPGCTRAEAGTTRARRLGAVSSWYMFLIRHRAAARNPAILDRAERPVRAPRKAPALSDAEAEAFLAAADADPSPRTAAVAWLLVTTGIRVGELCAANTADIGSERGVTVLHVHGKGGKTRMVEVEPSTYERVTAYLRGRADVDRTPVPAGQAGAGRAVVPLVATSTGGRMDRWYVRRLVRRLARAAGLAEHLVDRLCPHSTRATFITGAIEDGVPIRDIQEAAGHATPVTTGGYDRSQFTPERSPSRRVARRFHAERLDAQRQQDGADYT